MVTQQYVAGELSLLLAQMQAAAANDQTARDIDGLRREVETMPLAALASVTLRAVALADMMCWDSIAQGDTASFSRQAEACSRLYEFGVCANLLREQYQVTSTRQ